MENIASNYIENKEPMIEALESLIKTLCTFLGLLYV